MLILKYQNGNQPYEKFACERLPAACKNSMPLSASRTLPVFLFYLAASGKQNEPLLPPDAGKDTFVFTYFAFDRQAVYAFVCNWLPQRNT
jgi:hypothetical protein